MTDDNVHATAIVLATPGGPCGLLFTGASGAGKSALALMLLDEWRATDRFAALVADDRVILKARNGRLIASAPPTLAGLIERRGLGIERQDHLAQARLHLHVEIGETPERMPEAVSRSFEAISLASLRVPRLDGPHGHAAPGLVRAWLERPLEEEA